MLIERRALLTSLGSFVVAAPALVRASSLMPVKLVVWTPPLPSINAVCADTHELQVGFLERMAYHAMDNVLKAGWTPERAAPFYGGITEIKMWNAVAYARRHGFLT